MCISSPILKIGPIPVCREMDATGMRTKVLNPCARMQAICDRCCFQHDKLSGNDLRSTLKNTSILDLQNLQN